MRYQRHLQTAHLAWQKYQHAALVIDATCGNGHDTQVLAALQPRRLYAIDINPQAVANTRLRFPSADNISFLCQSHATFPPEIEPNSVDLIVYNLGYLPGGDKDVTTQTRSTLQSFTNALTLLKPSGLISATCYPGHPEGEREEKNLVAFAAALDPKHWTVQYTQWINREKGPTLLLVEKKRSEKTTP